MDELKKLRFTGLAGVLAALLMFAGDMFLYGGFYGGAEYYKVSREIMSEIPLLRLMIGGAIGPIAAILYVIGFWQIFLALKTGSKTLAKITFFAFTSMMIVGGAFHSDFVNTGLILRAKNSINAVDMEVMETLIAQSKTYINFLYQIVFVFGLIGTITFLYAVLFKKTRYPKWIVFFTPTLLTLTAPAARLLPSPVGGIVYGGYTNLSFFLFFCVSMFILW
ncbi:MAG: hypothetical protein GXO77_16995, partial [Calditrichaeota bacterium]|nr:hypothetical protein [Calditrichota bacterium]